jgi:hypothetical protein
MSVELFRFWRFGITEFILLLLPILVLFVVSTSFLKNARQLIIDAYAKTITSIHFFFRTKRIYHFDELDGYVTSRFIGANRSLTKVIWLVKNGVLIERINENFVGNMPELEQELKALKYLGYQQISNLNRIQLLFSKLKLSV